MKLHIFSFWVCLCLYLSAGAQIKTVELNKKYYQFNNGAELPAEQTFMVNTPIDDQVSMVTMLISSRDFANNNYQYRSVWEKKDLQSSVAQLISPYKLRQNSSYSFRFLYYRDISPAEREQVVELLTQSCYSALQLNIREKGSRYAAQRSPAAIYQMLNYTLKEGLSYYRQKQMFYKEEGFSELLEQQIGNLIRQKKDAGLGSTSNLEALRQQIATEISVIMNTYDYILDDTYEILQYPTEKLNNILALNAGYGGIYRSGDVNNLDYFSAPYAGLSFAFGNRVFSGSFWSNTSISAGVFLKNFNPSPTTEWSGPLVNLPLFAAAGYKVFNYFKINAGATIIEERKQLTGSKSIIVQPFIGLSLEMYLWMGFNKRR